MKTTTSDDNEAKIFPLAPLICLTSGLTSTRTLKPVALVVSFMMGISEAAMGSLEGMLIFESHGDACGRELMSQHPTLGQLGEEYHTFCKEVLPLIPKQEVHEYVDRWMSEKTAKLPVDLQEGFPIRKLENIPNPQQARRRRRTPSPEKRYLH
ncbi:MAG: hypothetical protein SFW62_10375 [Alphaproteobacteria bacterium]|nr:hypothetical protein [Alphaproteobacteria bacterium]